MENFFDRPMKQARLTVAAESWKGTRFVKGAAIKGGGVDCIHLAAEIYKECGLFNSYEFPRYTLDGGRHLKTSLVMGWLAQSKCFEEITNCELGITNCVKAGDLLCFKLSAVEHHVGVMLLGGQFVHAWMRRGVLFSLISDASYLRILTHIFRPIQPKVI